MATHSSVLAWRIPGMAGPGGLPSMGSHRVRHDWSDLAAAAGASVQFSSVSQSCSTPCDLMNCTMPGLPVHQQPPESTQTHVHCVGDAIQPSHPSVVPFCTCPQSFPASGFFQMSHLSASGGKSTGVSASTSVSPMNIQGWSPLGWTGWISLQSKGPQEPSPTPQFKSINSSALSFLYSPTLTSIHDHWKNHSLD